MARQTKDFKNLNCKVDIKVSKELETFEKMTLNYSQNNSSNC